MKKTSYNRGLIGFGVLWILLVLCFSTTSFAPYCDLSTETKAEAKVYEQFIDQFNTEDQLDQTKVAEYVRKKQESMEDSDIVTLLDKTISLLYQRDLTSKLAELLTQEKVKLESSSASAEPSGEEPISPEPAKTFRDLIGQISIGENVAKADYILQSNYGEMTRANLDVYEHLIERLNSSDSDLPPEEKQSFDESKTAFETKKNELITSAVTDLLTDSDWTLPVEPVAGVGDHPRIEKEVPNSDGSVTNVSLTFNKRLGGGQQGQVYHITLQIEGGQPRELAAKVINSENAWSSLLKRRTPSKKQKFLTKLKNFFSCCSREKVESNEGLKQITRENIEREADVGLELNGILGDRTEKTVGLVTPDNLGIEPSITDPVVLFEKAEGDLSGLNKQPDQVTLELLSDMLLSVLTLHQHAYTHRDIKLENFLYHQMGSMESIEDLSIAHSFTAITAALEAYTATEGDDAGGGAADLDALPPPGPEGEDLANTPADLDRFKILAVMADYGSTRQFTKDRDKQEIGLGTKDMQGSMAFDRKMLFTRVFKPLLEGKSAQETYDLYTQLKDVLKENLQVLDETANVLDQDWQTAIQEGFEADLESAITDSAIAVIKEITPDESLLSDNETWKTLSQETLDQMTANHYTDLSTIKKDLETLKTQDGQTQENKTLIDDLIQKLETKMNELSPPIEKEINEINFISDAVGLEVGDDVSFAITAPGGRFQRFLDQGISNSIIHPVDANGGVDLTKPYRLSMDIEDTGELGGEGITITKLPELTIDNMGGEDSYAWQGLQALNEKDTPEKQGQSRLMAQMGIGFVAGEGEGEAAVAAFLEGPGGRIPIKLDAKSLFSIN